jgi:hypothetical protein
MIVRVDIWSTSVVEISGSIFSPLSKRNLLSLIAKPKEWRRRHAFTYADPFMLVSMDRVWLFVEKQVRHEKGVICAYSSSDKETWVDHGVVLDELFHISYPQVIELDGGYWMLPETTQSGAVWLYRASCLPGPWVRHVQLLSLPHADPTILICPDKIYLWATSNNGTLKLYTADVITGPYAEHPNSPITADSRYARCGGRVFALPDGVIIRLAQDGLASYGKALHAMKIMELSPTSYRETLWKEDIVKSTHFWDKDGRHHLDFVKFKNSLLMAIDGKQKEFFINIFIRLFWRFVSIVQSVFKKK